MADFKDQISPAMVEGLAADLAGAGRGIDAPRFVALALDGLDELALMDRVRHIAAALVTTMPSDTDDADRVIRAALDAGGLQGWSSLPICEYVSISMLDEPETALPLLAELTPRFSAEFAIRPFIDTHFDITMRHLHAWVDHPDEHVRRLVSEGSRPRLPWGDRLRQLVDDPTPTIGLLDQLFDDPSEYVRRSVANHLNDISKDHPAFAVATAERWSTATTHGDYVIRHALRSLVKRGDPAALAVLGFGNADTIRLSGLACRPASIAIGGEVTFEFTAVADTDTAAVIDYLVHYQGATGRKAGKVFKLATRTLVASQPIIIERRHRFAHVSIRQIRPGPHRIEIQVNGRVLAGVEVDVTL
jgi:3-methyladenine DNA glycosylase AlkC